MTGYGDIRDVLATLPFPPDAGLAYAWSDVFTTRHQIIAAIEPAPRSVFEFGALRGFFLVTALDAAPSIVHVGWVDDETHTPGSNEMCAANLQRYVDRREQTGAYTTFGFVTGRDQIEAGASTDLVQVDADHSYEETLADLHTASRLDPQTIFVDDWTADHHTEAVQAAAQDWRTVEEERGVVWGRIEYPTVNGLAVFTRRT